MTILVSPYNQEEFDVVVNILSNSPEAMIIDLKNQQSQTLFFINITNIGDSVTLELTKPSDKSTEVKMQITVNVDDATKTY